MSTHEERLARARLSLEGLSVGDSLGGFFEFGRSEMQEYWRQTKTLPNGEWQFTDDTNMALSIYAILRKYQKIDQDALANHFAKHFDRRRGYGLGARKLLMKLQIGENWRDIAPHIFEGGSYGNGGAMRVAPLGAYFADDIEAVIENAKLSAEITHAHPEGIAGAIAVAVATSIACNADKLMNYHDFIDAVLAHVPDSMVKTNIAKGHDLKPETEIWIDVVKVLHNGSGISAQDTVPLVIWVSATCLGDFEKAIWKLIEARGDVDTTCAMVGGIVACYVGQDGIPKSWIEHREKLPQWAFEE